MRNKKIDITTTELYLNLITSFSYVNRSLKYFLAFVLRDIQRDKHLSKFKPSADEERYCITFELKTNNIHIVYLVINKDRTFMTIDNYSYKQNIFETDTREFFRTLENYNKILKEIKKKIKLYAKLGEEK